MKVDVAIIGAGSAGSVVAARLSEDPSRRVLLIEAGPDYPDFDALPPELKFGHGTGTDITTQSHNWTFPARPTVQDRMLQAVRGRVVGGTSAINGQVFRRGLADDFDSWASSGNTEWSFDKVLPYFCSIENDLQFGMLPYHGSSGPVTVTRMPEQAWQPVHLAFLQACLALGYSLDEDQNAPCATGVGGRPFNNFWGVRLSSALCFIAPVRKRKNLIIWPDRIVRRIRFQGPTARFIEVSGGPVEVVEASEVILSAGAIGSPQLLMLSGVGSADDLSSVGVRPVHDLPGVGGGLRDHPMVSLDFRVAADHIGPIGWAPRMPVDLRCTASASELRNDLQIIPRILSDPSSRSDQPAVMRMTAAIQLEKSSGRIRLQSSEIEVPPAIDYCFLTETNDRDRLRDGLRTVLLIAATDPMAALGVGRMPFNADSRTLESDELLDSWMFGNVGIEQHSTSTCKMGPASDSKAVVDQFGRVHGLDNVRVIDASIMPDCIRANANATTMMMAERISSSMLRT